MTPIPPPPKVNPSALALGGEMIAKAVSKAAQTVRHEPVLAGFKRVYHQGRPHQGNREIQRRLKQLQRVRSKCVK